jgi:hypothetical protein
MILPLLLLLAQGARASEPRGRAAELRLQVANLVLAARPELDRRADWSLLPEPRKVSDVQGLGPLLGVASRSFKWGLFSSRMLGDLAILGAGDAGGALSSEALLGAPVQARDTCLAQPADLGERGVDPGVAARCPPPVPAGPGTPLRVVPRLYQEGRLGVALVGSL